MHLKHLNEHYAHQVSKEIMDFCKENQTGILVLPEYDEDFSRISMYRSGNYSAPSLKYPHPELSEIQSLGRRNPGT